MQRWYLQVGEYWYLPATLQPMLYSCSSKITAQRIMPRDAEPSKMDVPQQCAGKQTRLCSGNIQCTCPSMGSLLLRQVHEPGCPRALELESTEIEAFCNWLEMSHRQGKNTKHNNMDSATLPTSLQMSTSQSTADDNKDTSCILWHENEDTCDWSIDAM